MAKVEGPDQPYSWIIALAACVINSLLSGIGRATGIFYVALIDVYGVTRLEANLPFTLRYSVRNLAGPAVGILGQRYGVRIISIVGSILAISGVILCTFAPNILWISIFWGGFHGMGVALANTLFQVTVNQYFVKYRATASGISLSGACIGSFLFPVLLEILLEGYGLQGAFLLTGALIMHALPASMLLTEPSWLQTSSKEQIRSVKVNPSLKQLGSLSESNSAHDFAMRKHVGTKHDLKSDKIDHAKIQSSNKHGLKQSHGFTIKDGVDNPCFTEQDKGSESTSNNKYQNVEKKFISSQCRKISSGEISLTMFSIQEDKISTTEKRSLLKMLLCVLQNPMFYMISISLATFAILFDPLMIVIVDYIKDKGLDDHVGKYLISILAFGDLGGRLGFGWVTDKKFVSIPKFMMLVQLIQGICFTLLPLFYAFEVLMCLIVLYGVTAGTTIVMFPILVAKYLPSEQSIAIGCVSFFAGICTFIIPPLIGHFRDKQGSYDGMFYITGSLSVITGLLWLLEPWLVKLSKERTVTIEDSAENR